MPRQMTEEQKQKMIDGRAAKRLPRTQVITVAEWQIFQSDERNWVLRKGDSGENRYYPTLVSALQGLLHQRIGEAQSKSLTAILSAVQKAESEIVSAASR